MANELLETLGRVVLTFQSAPQGVSGRIWDEVKPWMANLVRFAAPKWLPRLSFGFACTLPRPDGHACPRPAVAACDACGRPVCLDHCRIDQWGDGICYACCWEIQQKKQAERAAGAPPPGRAPHDAGAAQQAPPIPEKELTWARRMLGVKKDTEWELVRTAHRKLSARWHPDRHQGPGYAAAEQKFKDVQRAFELLTKDRERKEAA